MKAITLRGLDEELSQALQAEAKRSGMSLNSTVAVKLRQAFGLDKTSYSREYHDLDSLAGTWSAEQQTTFEKATKPFSEIDEELWS